MKVRIQSGASCIEIEGDKAEVSDILERWWQPIPTEEDVGEVEVTPADKQQSRRRGAKRSTRPASTPKEGASKINAEEVANQIKEHDRFELFNSVFILGSPPRADRARFISWLLADTPITSGDVSRVMTALGVKFDAATASKAMGDASRDWIKDSSGPQTTFRLSAPARHAFEQKLLNAKPKT